MHVLQQQNLPTRSDEHIQQHDGNDIYHIIRLLHEVRISDAQPSTIERAGPSIYHPPLPRSYPDFILETAHLSPATTVINGGLSSPLWRQILTYWFPPSEGFIIIDDWRCGNNHQPPNMSVLYQDQAVLLLQLHGEINLDLDISQQILRNNADQLFDAVAVWSGHPALCVVSAIGARWNTFIRSTDMTSEIAKQILGYDWYGEWSEDVASDRSHELLGRYFGILKTSLRI
ncbi:hypothetical protein BJ165DRAFT_272764 [Panaeolus papilionaceus]|nr:hypothetical protein BJ165DRAFT_272764 [Panaeolus papilionaceus]